MKYLLYKPALPKLETDAVSSNFWESRLNPALQVFSLLSLPLIWNRPALDSPWTFHQNAARLCHVLLCSDYYLVNLHVHFHIIISLSLGGSSVAKATKSGANTACPLPQI